MKKYYAVFAGTKIVSRHWTEDSAKQQLVAGQHIRLLIQYGPQTRWVPLTTVASWRKH